MQRGRCCRCDGKKIRAVTIKGLAQSNGATQWEYGPGALWRQQHAGNRITGIKWNSAATLNKFVLICGTADAWQNPPASRVSGAYPANAMQPLTLQTISADDGSEIESAALELFCWQVSDDQFVLGTQYSSEYNIREVLTLSGGDYLIAGARVPVLEWVDYTTNTSAKEYVLHAHIQQAGNVYFKTLTSSETITLAYNSTASAVKTAFEATADCVTCTATGGPWPHRKIEISVTWSASNGDIAQMKRDGTYTATGSTGTCTWDWQVIPPSGGSWILNTDLCTGGSTATAPVGSGSPGDVGIPGTCSGGSGGSVTRRTDGSVATYSPSTGLIQTSAGYIFGRDNTTPSKLVTETGSAPSHGNAANQPCPGSSFGIGYPRSIASGNSNVVGMITQNGNVDGQTVECWLPGSPWVRQWQKYNNANADVLIFSEGSYFGIPVPRKAFSGGSTTAAVRVGQTTGTVTEYDRSEVSTSTWNGQNSHGSRLLFDDQSKWVTAAYPRSSNPTADNQFGSVFQFDGFGSEVMADSTVLKLATNPSFTSVYGATTSNVFLAGSSGAYSAVNVLLYKTTTSATGNDTTYQWLFYAPRGGHNGPSTQWRFVFRGGTTSWLNWNATAAQIKTAFLAVYPENTTGTVSNIVVTIFSPSTVNTIGCFERSMSILFRGAANATGLALGFPLRSHFDRLDDIRIEFQNVTGTNTAGIASYSASTGAQNWARNFGTSLTTAATVTFPKAGWLYSDKLVCYGEQVENELP